MNVCPACKKEPATIHPLYGILPGVSCQQRLSAQTGPHPIEFTSQSIKDQRRQFRQDILQPWRSGEPSREFIQTYPTESKRLFTPDEIKRAKDVWKDL